jgi:diguanylate cyclase (GGDEF)-like protein
MHASGATVTTMVTLAWMDTPDDSRQLLAQIEDITARRTVEEVLRRQAEQDGLTGLANRTLLGRMLCEMGESAQPCAILFIDLDGFKLINDTRGHDVGDEVLLEVASRLRTAVRPSDVVARFGGDEFVVVCSGGSQGDELTVARRVADRIELSLRRPIVTQDGPASVTASIGIAGGLVDPHAPQELLQRADAAMYQAKRLGKDRREIYDATLHERALEHQRTEAALRNALDDDRFVVHYQPIVDLADSTIVGFEALVRLVDEDGRLVAPDKFITVAEQSGLIVPMGAWVLAESCRTIAWLREQTGRPFTVSVNLAARQAARTDLALTVSTALASSGLPHSALTLELTESALLEADESTLAQLVALRAQGVVIGLDDFGTGYSSLTYLRRFPVSHLKIDRSFVAGMQSEASDLAIVRAVANLATDLGLRWIAEGVETEAQRDLLAGLGPGLAQGYLFSRPVPRSELIRVVSPLDRTA